MREAIIVLAVSATCLFTSPARSQETAPAPQVKSQLARGYRLRTANRNTDVLPAASSFLTSSAVSFLHLPPYLGI